MASKLTREAMAAYLRGYVHACEFAGVDVKERAEPDARETTAPGSLSHERVPPLNEDRTPPLAPSDPGMAVDGADSEEKERGGDEDYVARLGAENETLRQANEGQDRIQCELRAKIRDLVGLGDSLDPDGAHDDAMRTERRLEEQSCERTVAICRECGATVDVNYEHHECPRPLRQWRLNESYPHQVYEVPLQEGDLERDLWIGGFRDVANAQAAITAFNAYQRQLIAPPSQDDALISAGMVLGLRTAAEDLRSRDFISAAGILDDRADGVSRSRVRRLA